MIKGVTVLGDIKEIMGLPLELYAIEGVVIIALVIMMIVIIVTRNDTVAKVCLVLAIIMSVIWYGINVLGKEPTGKHKYEVLVSDEVRLNEFLDKYKIIEQKENTYIVIEK